MGRDACSQTCMRAPPASWALRGHSEAGKGRKIIVLLTDGEHNVQPPALKPREAAQLAGKMLVRAGLGFTEPAQSHFGNRRLEVVVHEHQRGIEVSGDVVPHVHARRAGLPRRG